MHRALIVVEAPIADKLIKDHQGHLLFFWNQPAAIVVKAKSLSTKRKIKINETLFMNMTLIKNRSTTLIKVQLKLITNFFRWFF